MTLDNHAEGIPHQDGLYGGFAAIHVTTALRAGISLSATGYAPDAVQTPAALTGIRLLVGPFPAVFFAAAVAVLTAYPITRAAHAKLRERLTRAS